jgi:hypothetical protein
MSENRFPLIVNSETNQIEELASGDNLDLTGSQIVNAVSISAGQFVGNLTGTASSATTLVNASNILTGTISSQRLSGNYNIQVAQADVASTLTSANNIQSGTINPARLSGTYAINISGTAARSEGLSNAANIEGGIIDSGRLSGTYNINISGVSNSAVNATNVIGGISSVTTSNVSGISTFRNNVFLENNANLSVTGFSTFSNSIRVVGDVNSTGIVTSRGINVSPGIITASSYRGDGVALAGIVTQISIGVGMTLTATQIPGKGIVQVGIKTDIGKTIFVSIRGSDSNTGLVESDAKRTIKAAAEMAEQGDTIKVFAGTYVEDNPILLKKDVAVEGAELRNCLISPQNPGEDLFYVNNGCHLTDLSFVGTPSKNGAAVVTFEPLLGTASGRFFDGARLIRQNLEFISYEAVGFLTSGFSGFAGTHVAQDAARLIDLNLDYIAAETVGFLTASSPTGYGFTLSPANNASCYDDVKDVLKAVSYDLKATGNEKSVGAGFSYFSPGGALLHVVGIQTRAATVAALNYAAGIATYVINNQTPPLSFQAIIPQTTDASVIYNPALCVGTANSIRSLVGIITNMIGAASTASAPQIIRGVNLDTNVCARDVRYMLRAVCHDITRGGNSKCVAVGKSYYDQNGNKIISILSSQNPNEYNQTIATFDYAFNIARAVINNVTWGGYPVGLGTTVVNAVYNNRTGLTTITAINHGLSLRDPVKLVGLGFTCAYNNGATTLFYPDGAFGNTFQVNKVINANSFEVVVGMSTIAHLYSGGGTIQKYRPFQNNWTQVKDLSMQIDPYSGYNDSINSCVNVISAVRSCIGVVTTIVGAGFTALRSLANPTGILTTYPGNAGVGTITQNGATFKVSNATYNNVTGVATITAPGAAIRIGDKVKLEGLVFQCTSGGPISTAIYPSGNLGYQFKVLDIEGDNTFNVSNAVYNNITGIVTVTAPGIKSVVNDIIELRNLVFQCNSGGGPSTAIYPSGNLGYKFRVLTSIGSTFTLDVGISTLAHTYISGGTAVNRTKRTDDVFTVNVGVSTLAHTYVSGGTVFPPYGTGVGNVIKGPYVRNCTNFIPDSIGMKVDGFDAEPGDLDETGITGMMSVDSYTQYNQGGIGVSISNGAYAQLVSIFTICDDVAIYTDQAGQCDITNSNSSFGRLGLVSKGVGDNESKSIYRYTGFAHTEALLEQDQIVISGVGTNRPYDGQGIYFGNLFYDIERIQVTNGGSGYTSPPAVIIDVPQGPSGIRAEASANIDSSGTVTSVDIISTGSQYLPSPGIAFTGGGGVGAAATAILRPFYYKVESATLPVAGITTITLTSNLNNTVSAGTTVYFSRLSLQIASSHSFEYIGSGNFIEPARPSKGGVTIQENEVVKLDGGEIVYTSTDQAGNFRIGDDVVINQLTGTVSGRAFSQSLLNTVTPLIIALGK